MGREKGLSVAMGKLHVLTEEETAIKRMNGKDPDRHFQLSASEIFGKP